MEKIRLSPSRVNEFRNCPRQYKYRVIDQLPEPASIDAERGTLIHSILHDLLGEERERRTFDRARELAPLKWQEQKESKPELEALIPHEKEWLDRVEALLENYFIVENPQQFEPTHREIHLELDLNESTYLHGYVDRIDVAPSGEVRIVDYKTGKSPKPGWEDKALFQVRVYALLYRKRYGVIPHLLQLFYLGDCGSIKSRPIETVLKQTENQLLEVSERIQQAHIEGNWPARPSRLCDWCSFKSICPAFN